MPGCQDTVARQPRLYTPVRPESGRHGGAGPFVDRLVYRVGHLHHVSARTAGAPAAPLRHRLQVGPAVEGELPGLAAQRRLPRRPVAPRRVLWALGR